MANFYASYPITGGGGGVPTYPNLAGFPSAITAGNGALGIALDTGILYESNGTTWVPIGGPGVALSIGPIDSVSPSANGAVISANALIMQSASVSVPGLVNLTTQSFAGDKTFTGNISALNLSGTNTGDVTIGTANGLSLAAQVLSLGLSSTSTTGALSSTDWNTFNGKFNLPALTAGSVLFSDGTTIAQDNANFFWNASTHRLGIGTTAPTNDITFGGDAVRVIAMNRNSTTVGSGLTLGTGGAMSGGTDLNGGTLTLRSGLSTGTGASNIAFQTYTPASASASSDNSASVKMTLNGNGNLGIGVGSPAANLSVSGARSGLPGATGSIFDISPSTFTDNTTLANGTVNFFAMSRMGGYTLAATNTNVTTVNAIGTRTTPIIAGTNQTITNSIAYYVPTSALTGTITNSYGMVIATISGATNNYGLSVAGNAGFGGNLAPMAMVDASANGVTAGTNEQLMLTSQRAAIVAGNMIGGIGFKSNDTNLTAPGTVVALIDAIATAIHTASVLDTALTFTTTATLSTTEKMRITSGGNVLIGNTTGTALLSVGSTSQFNVTSAGAMTAASAVISGLTTNGFVTTSGGTGTLGVTTSIANTSLAAMPTLTLKGNNTGGSTTPLDLTVSQVNTMLGNLSNPMTTGGDIIYGGTSGTPTRLANGTAAQVLASTGGTTAPVWKTLLTSTRQILLSGTTYTLPAGCTLIKVTVIGAGGGGGGCTTGVGSSCGSGGGGGGTAIKWIASPSASYGYVIGTAGTAGTAPGGSGGNGGDSTFNTTIIGGGGSGGGGSGGTASVATLSAAGGQGGLGSGGDLGVRGEAGGNGIIYSASTCEAGYGGGTSFGFGPQGRISSTGAGTVGGSYGTGGSGGALVSGGANQAGAAGNLGVIIVEEFYQ